MTLIPSQSEPLWTGAKVPSDTKACPDDAVSLPPRRRRSSRFIGAMSPALALPSGPASYQSLFKPEMLPEPLSPTAPLPPVKIKKSPPSDDGFHEQVLSVKAPARLPAPNAPSDGTRLERSRSLGRARASCRRKSAEPEPAPGSGINNMPAPIRRGRSRSAGLVTLAGRGSNHGSDVQFCHDGISTQSMVQIAYLLPPGASAAVSYYDRGEARRGTIHTNEDGQAIITPADHSKRMVVTSDLLPRLKLSHFNSLACVPRIYRA